MRKFLVLLVVVFVVLVAVYRQRLYLRDPLGKVERAGVRQEGEKVFINYENDVLLQAPEGTQSILVQGRGAVPGMPEHLFCVRELMCLTDADTAAVLPLGGAGASRQVPVMTSEEVHFNDANGVGVAVQLR